MRFFHSFSRKREKRIVSLFVLLGTISAQNLSFKDMAVEDVAAAQYIYSQAQEKEAGVWVDM